MSIKPIRNPYGYKELLVYKKADELQSACANFTTLFPPLKTLYSLKDQMNRSARSTKQNIVEGWRRNSTNEYYEFLGYSIGSNAELEEDFTDIWKGHYPELMGIKGIMGEKGEEKKEELGIMGEMGWGEKREEKGISEGGTREKKEEEGREKGRINDIESLPFYPLDLLLPLVVQLKLRAKELNFLLEKLQKSLKEKMSMEQTLSTKDRIKIAQDREDSFDRWLKDEREKGRNGINGNNREQKGG